MKVKNLQDLFVDTIKDIYNAEEQITKALPKMAKAATNPQLKSGFEQHLEQTKQQHEMLRQVFEEIDMKPSGKKCVGMEGIIAEGDEIMAESAEPDVLDAALIAAAQKVEHYEISAYGTARTFAQRLGYTKSAKVLQQILEQEKQTDQRLTALAEGGINQEAKR